MIPTPTPGRDSGAWSGRIWYGLVSARLFGCGCAGFCVSEQDGHASGAVHLTLHEEFAGQLEELGMVLEVLCGGLHSADYVLG